MLSVRSPFWVIAGTSTCDAFSHRPLQFLILRRRCWLARRFGVVSDQICFALKKYMSFGNQLRIMCCAFVGIGFPLKKREKVASCSKGICFSSQQGPPPAWPGRAVADACQRSWEGPKPISIVESTGSIGTQTLDIMAENPDKFRIVALAAGSNVTLLAVQVRISPTIVKPQLVVVRNESLVDELKDALADAEHQPEMNQWSSLKILDTFAF
ncbi:hypothetical protein KSP40_PGU004720 [Platanthera guangdongensis]|uniref:1-deoxy-D-xylulose 5-phosphate reductoisomerase N-terminal domain-containing protein n=1 Tax=Platanthera guangdongensis TaxID=2320717 RepID=A0ABR2M9G7_9ASPA